MIFRPLNSPGPPLVAAVADGHGSSKSFRSDIGSKLAAAVASDTLLAFAESWGKPGHLTAVKRAAEDHLPLALVRAWRHEVDKHLAGTDFTPDEIERLIAREGQAAADAVKNNPALAYGSTLVAVVVAETFVLFLQLGDGDILVVEADEEVTTPLGLEGDDKPIGEETVSLCSPNAEHSFRVAFRPLVGKLPSLILVSTDGYSKSYPETSGFLQVGPDILNRLRNVGLEAVRDEIEGWLTQVSSRGSGDDVTLALLYRETVAGRSHVGTSATVEPAGPAILPSDPKNQEFRR